MKQKLINKLKKIMPKAKKISLILLLIINSFWFIFALLSGSEEYGGGLKGILMNSPNAIPWLIMFGLIYVAWKWELIGGIIITIMGLFTIFMFDTYEYFISFITISLPFIIIGAIFILNWYFKKYK
jgi:hypothetical protein